MTQVLEATARMQTAMEEASSVVLDGFPLASDVKVVCHPERYMDEGGREMWDKVMKLLPA